MALENIGEFVRDLLREDDSLSDPNYCRDSVSKIKGQVIKKFPNTKADFLVYPEPRKGLGVHYSLLVSQGDEKMLVNTVPAPGFPKYIGDPKTAVPTFSTMKIVSKVI